MSGPFTAALRDFEVKTSNRIDTVIQQTRREIYTRVVLRSPVDSGKFRANWHIERTPQTQTHDKTSGYLDAAYNVIESIPTHHTVWIINALPYGLVLEYGLYGTGKWATVKTTRDGYSVQAPYGMVRITVVEFKDIVRDAVLIAKSLHP